MLRSPRSRLASGLIGAASTVVLLVLLRSLGINAALALVALWLFGTVVAVRAVRARARREGRAPSVATIVPWTVQALLTRAPEHASPMRLRDRLRLALTGRGTLTAFTDEERLVRIARWNDGSGGDQMSGWEYLHFRSEEEYRAWAERVGSPPMLDEWDPVRLQRVDDLHRADARPPDAAAD